MTKETTESNDLIEPLDFDDLGTALSATQLSVSVAGALGVKIDDADKHAARLRTVKGSVETGTTILAGGAAVVGASSLTVAATSGAGIASGLAAAGSVVGGGMAAGPAALAAGPTYLATRAINKTLFASSIEDDVTEAKAKKIARLSTTAGGALGVVGTGAAVVAGGASGPAIMGTLATAGSVVGGGALAGVGVFALAPVAAACGIGYFAYRAFGGGKKKPKT